MTVRDVRPGEYRAAATSLLSAAGDLRAGAAGLEELSSAVSTGWAGAHGERWTARVLLLKASAERLGEVLVALVRPLQALADEVEEAQAALGRLARQAEEVERRDAQARAAWAVVPAGGRGAPPDASWELAALHAEEQAVERRATDAAEAASAALRARLPELPTPLPSSSVLPAVGRVLEGAFEHGYQLPAGVRDLDDAWRRHRSGRRPLVPSPLRVPAARVRQALRPAGSVLDSAGRVLGPVGTAVDLRALGAGPEPGARGALDYGVTAVGVAAAVAGGVAAAAGGGAALGTGAAVAATATTAYAVGTSAWDALAPHLGRLHLPWWASRQGAAPGRRTARRAAAPARGAGGRAPAVPRARAAAVRPSAPAGLRVAAA